jgi:hypothetical protein
MTTTGADRGVEQTRGAKSDGWYPYVDTRIAGAVDVVSS